MYLQSLYVKSDTPETYFVEELDFSSDIKDIFDSGKFESFTKALFVKDILIKILQIDIKLIKIIDKEKFDDSNE